MDKSRADRLREAVIEAVGKIIESMAFTIAEPLESAQQINDDLIGASLRVLEPHSGEIRLVMPIPAAQALARVLYNMEESDITQDILHDVIGEFLNMISGTIMGLLLPPDTPFRLGIPETAPSASSQTTSGLTTWWFACDGHPLIVMIDGNLVGE